ncbi:hypothetical protein ACFDDV_02140 [Enterococcus lactis]|uniref:hypothetical protein n=1 Tax=Enterococcus TaxID=1350 RepID=UPI00069DA93C|nr:MULTISPECIES: hypothetical protein [Enterococcus]MCX4060867.1 hypothetical protein [Enterococcus faecium]NEX85362.1 hypothetical protein [Enterococcus durans]RXE78800.1 hypothetical protein EIA52_07770 [Enterococcus durans]
MTNGTSQGLFIVVAIIIFGIFVFISYLLFRDTLKPSLSTIYCDAFEQVNEQTEISEIDTDNCIDEKFTNSLDKHSNFEFILDINTSSSSSRELSRITKETINDIVEFNITSPDILSQIDNDGYLSRVTGSSFDGLAFTLTKFTTKQKYLDAGFPTSYSDRQYKVSFSSNFTKSRYSWGVADIQGRVFYNPQTANPFKIKVNEVNEFTFTFENKFGGKSTFKFKIKPIANI